VNSYQDGRQMDTLRIRCPSGGRLGISLQQFRPLTDHDLRSYGLATTVQMEWSGLQPPSVHNQSARHVHEQSANHNHHYL
jgi:hypothetical protein